MKMIDMGKKETTGPCCPEPASKEKKTRICYPGLSIYDNVPDVLFNKDVGETIEARVVIKLSNKGLDESGDRKNRRVSFDVLKMGIDESESDLEKEIKRQSGVKEESGEEDDNKV